MSALISAIDAMAAVPNEALTKHEITDDIEEALSGIEKLRVLVAERTRGMQERNDHQDLGYPSPTAMLADRGKMSFGHARQMVAMANARHKAPVAYQAWEDGRLSTDQAIQVFRLAESLPQELPDAEEKLVEIIEPLSVSDTGRALEYWRQSVDGPGDTSLESQMDRRGVSLSKTIGGMRRVDGWMTALAGEALEAALEAHTPPPAEEDTRTPRQRCHDALEEMARCHLDHGDVPIVGGEKPHVIVLSDVDGLKGVAGGTHETLKGEVLDVEAIRVLSCDSSVSRIVLGPDSEILDVGRKTRVWPTAIRRAIIARDRHCTAPGCDRPPQWCDIHHSDHWADGGETSVDKGKLFCRFHHVKEHLKEHLRRKGRPT